VNEPLMHALIAFAARYTELDPSPTRTEAQDLARDVAEECRLDTRDADALRNAAEQFVVPVEVSAQEMLEEGLLGDEFLLEDAPCLAAGSQDYEAGVIELRDRERQASALSPEAALFDAAEDFAERLDILIREHDPRQSGTDTRFSAWTFVAFIEPCANLKIRNEVASLGLRAKIRDQVASLGPRAITSEEKQKLLLSCDFHTSHARSIRALRAERWNWSHYLVETTRVPGVTLTLGACLANATSGSSGVSDDVARWVLRTPHHVQTLFFFEQHPEQRSWPTQIDWSIDAMLRGVSRSVEESEDTADYRDDARLARFLRLLAK